MLFSAVFLCAQPQASPPTGKTDDALDLVKQGQKLNSDGKQDEALALYDRALQLSPNLVQADLAAGIALDLQGKYEQARQHLTKAIDEAPPASKVLALRTMAVSYAFERNTDEARKYEQQAFDVQESAKQYADAAGTADELARIYLESGDTDNAFQWYQSGHLIALRQPNLSPADKDLWEFRWESALARIRVRQTGRGAEAANHLAAAKAILDKGTNPDQVRFYPYLSGYVAFYQHDYKTAIAELQKGDQKDPVRPQLAGSGVREVGRQSAGAGLLPQSLDHQFAQSDQRVCASAGKRKDCRAFQIDCDELENWSGVRGSNP